jgi:hypothetical protein
MKHGSWNRDRNSRRVMHVSVTVTRLCVSKRRSGLSDSYAPLWDALRAEHDGNKWIPALYIPGLSLVWLRESCVVDGHQG